MNKKTKMLIQEISRLSDKLEDNRLTLEEKLTLTALRKEKIEEFRKLCELYREIRDKPKPEYKLATREEVIEEQKKHIETIKDAIEQCKKNNNISLLNSMVILLEQQKENLKYLEERPDTTPTVYHDFLGYSHFKKPRKKK